MVMTAALGAAAVLATMAAAYTAFADGALLAVDDEEPPGPSVAEFVARREVAHRALALARILAQLLAGAAAVGALQASPIPPVQVAPLVVVAGILAVVMAESAARTWGDMAAGAGVARCARGIRAVERVMAPGVRLGAWADGVLDRLLPAPAAVGSDRESTVEQFREVVEAEVAASPDDHQLLRGVFSLGDTTVQDIMVPRVDVVGVDGAASWAAVVERIRSARHARYPVYDRTLDNVVGILHAKDLLPLVINGTEPAGGWPTLARAAQFIPATKPVDLQLRDFKASRLHMAIVVDEFGGTAGVVTLEDALEVIVGEIQDEHDADEPDVRRVAAGRYSVSARVPLDELSEITGSDFAREGVNTVGGLVYAVVGGVPRQGDGITISGHRLVVERVSRRRIQRVGVERVGAPR
ncbi:MAG: hemolysin family protein [Gemmatimonadota bacterium]|nr:hemolysin family protein [Gemmatimonadota bacterium]